MEIKNTATKHYELGEADFKARRFKEAVEQFQEYLRLNPNDPAGHHSLAMAYCELGRFDLAVEPFVQALRLGPEFGEVYPWCKEANRGSL
jgi:Flp pilus assembly protein TadD